MYRRFGGPPYHAGAGSAVFRFGPELFISIHDIVYAAGPFTVTAFQLTQPGLGVVQLQHTNKRERIHMKVQLKYHPEVPPFLLKYSGAVSIPENRLILQSSCAATQPLSVRSGLTASKCFYRSPERSNTMREVFYTHVMALLTSSGLKVIPLLRTISLWCKGVSGEY